LLAGRVELAQPLLGHEDVAGGAFAGPAAQALHGQAPVPDDLHHPPALDGLEGMALAGPVGHMDNAHEAGIPSRGVRETARGPAPSGWISTFRPVASMV